MPITIKNQKDYLVTEAAIETTSLDLSELDYLMKAAHGTGKIVSVYCGGGVIGVSVEQRTRVPESVSQKVRDLVGVENQDVEVQMNGHKTKAAPKFHTSK